MLYGRDRERAALSRLLENAVRSEAGSVVLVGEAGIGKTALLEAVCAQGADALRPLGAAIDTLTGSLRAARDGAIGRGPVVPAAPFAVGVATLSLIAAAAEESTL